MGRALGQKVASLRVMSQQKPNWTDVPPRDWGEAQAYCISRQVRRLRGKRSAQWLADRTTELGYTVTRAVISDIENGRRRYVTTAELVILAAALDAAPIVLLYPPLYADQTELLPGVDVSKLWAVEWFSGSDYFSVTNDEERHPDFPVDYRTHHRSVHALHRERTLRNLEGRKRNYEFSLATEERKQRMEEVMGQKLEHLIHEYDGQIAEIKEELAALAKELDDKDGG